jgi:hypothetical protein
MKKQLYPAAILLSALLPVSIQAAPSVYEGFTQGTGNPALAGYSGTSEIGLSGTWTELGGQAMTIRDGSGGQWGTPQSYWPAAEHTAWNLTQATRPMTGLVDLTTDGSFYLSYYIGTDQADHGSQVGLINSANTAELMAGNGYGGAGKGVTAYIGSIGGSIQQNANGTDIQGGWSGAMRQYQVIAAFNRSGGNLNVTLDYYLGTCDGVAETSRTVSLGAVSDTFNTLTFKADGWMNLDEIRLGPTLADVAPVPEPATMALVGMSLAGLLVFKRRQS